jgi:pimeloyl-ACP methyl ester carboxylesterase
MGDPIPPWPGALVALDIGDVFVRAAPSAPGAEPALFVHGLGGSSRNWTDIMDLLSRPGGAADSAEAAGPQVTGPARSSPALRNSAVAGPVLPSPVLACEALDLPGFGYSPVPANGDYSIGARAAAVIALIDKRGQWPVHLIGNSLGGAVCTRVAARRPDLVRTLTLISPALPDLRPRLLSLRVGVLGVPGLGRRALDRVTMASAEDRAIETIRQVYANPNLMHPDRVREEVAEVTRRDGLGYQAEVFLGSARSLVLEYVRRGPGALWRDAARVAAPTLVIHGSHDRLVNPAMAARAARVFPSAYAVVLPRIGHVAMMERPDLVARVMREFLATAKPGRSAGPAAVTSSEADRVPN